MREERMDRGQEEEEQRICTGECVCMCMSL